MKNWVLIFTVSIISCLSTLAFSGKIEINFNYVSKEEMTQTKNSNFNLNCFDKNNKENICLQKANKNNHNFI